jgi:hypothetical protein
MAALPISSYLFYQYPLVAKELSSAPYDLNCVGAQ